MFDLKLIMQALELLKKKSTIAVILLGILGYVGYEKYGDDIINSSPAVKKYVEKAGDVKEKVQSATGKN